MSDEPTYDRRLDFPNDVATTTGDSGPIQQRPDVPQRTKRLGTALVLIGGAWLAVAAFGQFGGGWAGWGGMGESTVFEQTATGARRIEMSVGSANVSVRTWEGQGIRVEATQRGGRAEDFNIAFEPSGDVVRVDSTPNGFFCFFCSRELHYDVLVPADGQVDVQTTSGSIELVDVQGAQTISTVSGDIEATNTAGTTQINTSSGDVTLQGAGGQLTVDTTSGDVQLSDGTQTSAQVKTVSGDIDLQGVANNVNVETTSGDTELTDGRDVRLVFSSASGELRYEGSLARGGTNTITTISGDVHLQLPSDSGFALVADSVNGEMGVGAFDGLADEQSGRSLNATVGDGSAKLNINTTSGDAQVEAQ